MTDSGQQTSSSVPWYRGLQAKITGALILVTTVVLAGFSVYNLQNARERFEEELSTLAETTAARLAQNLEGTFWALNDGQLEDQLRANMLERRVQGVVLRDRDRERIYMAMERTSNGQAQLTGRAPTGDLIKSEIALTHEHRTIGELEVYVTPRFMQQRFNEQVKVEIARTLALDLAIIIALVLVIRRTLVRRIIALTASTEEVAKGRLETEIPVEGRDEINLLANATRKLQTSMRMAVDRLKGRR